MKIVIYMFIISVLLFSCERAPGEFESDNFIKFFGNGYESRGYDVIQLSDGNYVLTGYDYKTESDKQILLVKLDKYGDPLWSKNFGTANFDEEGKVVKELSDGFLIAGTSELSAGFFHSFILKTGPSGDSLWYKEFGDSAVNIIVNDFDIQGGFIYAVGESYQTAAASTPDFYAVKLSPEGELVDEGGGTFPNTNSMLKKIFIQNLDILGVGDFGSENRMSLFLMGNDNLNSGDGNYRFGLVDEVIADAAFVDNQLFTLSNAAGFTKLSKYTIPKIKVDGPPEWISESYNSIVGKALLIRDDGSFIVFGESGAAGSTQINTIKVDSDGTTNSTADFRTVPGTINKVRQTLDGGVILIGSTNATYGVSVQLIKTGKDLFILKQ